jgi:hypothetical protein
MKSCHGAVGQRRYWIRERFGFSATLADDFQSGSDKIDHCLPMIMLRPLKFMHFRSGCHPHWFMMVLIDHSRLVASRQKVDVGGCMALHRMLDAFGHVLMSDLLCRGQRVRDLSDMAAFHPQRLGQMVSRRRGINIQGFCNFSR